MKPFPLPWHLLMAILAATLTLFHPASTRAQTPPAQPKSGPGGIEHSHEKVIASLHGEDGLSYWLFEPGAPAPDHAPVIVFNHGWSAMEPKVYGAWIAHLVKRGNIVIYPRYQKDLRTPAAEFTPNAIAAVSDALHLLQTQPGHVKPDLAKFAIAGHSMGGVISANMAALWKSAGLPQPRAVMSVEPGKTWGDLPAAAIHLEDLSRIPRETLLLTVTGDRDTLVRDIDAKRIFNESTQIPLENKDYVTLVSDNHGHPALSATHMAPVAPGGDFTEPAGAGEPESTGLVRSWLRQRMEARRTAQEQDDASGQPSFTGPIGVDALDWYGTWKLLDALTDATFYGRNREYALGNTSQQRYMGLWSDGTPVKELRVTKKP